MTPTESILIIDDEELLRTHLRILLEELGYRVAEADNGREGLARCRDLRPDLVLLDVRMPEADGFEICGWLKADAALRDIPVIFLSGVMEAKDKVKAFQAGAVDYVTKPYHFQEVAARVRTHLALRHARRDLEDQNLALQGALEETRILNRKHIEMNERLRQSEALKSQFLATMRNEINNPLSAILGLGQELERGEVPAARAGMVGGMIAAEASGLDFQIRNIFCAADLESGAAEPAITLVDTGSVLRDVLDSLTYPCRDKGVTIQLDAAGAGRPFGTDAALLRALAANLVSNAVKFSRDGGAVQVLLRLDEDALVLEVKDGGVGFRPEAKAVIFERFRQLEAGAARLYQGQGLGLAVVKAVVDLLDGTIMAASEPGVGSVFTCRLPERTPQAQGDDSTLDGNVFFFGETEEV